MISCSMRILVMRALRSAAKMERTAQVVAARATRTVHMREISACGVGGVSEGCGLGDEDSGVDGTGWCSE